MSVVRFPSIPDATGKNDKRSTTDRPGTTSGTKSRPGTADSRPGTAGTNDSRPGTADSQYDNENDEDRYEREQEELENARKGKIEKVMSVVRLGLKAVKETMVDYGPPYLPLNEKENSLCLECSQMKASPYQVHCMLNKKADPNISDPDELHYSPLHHCARYIHMSIMRMLFHAHANPNVTDELGMTPLMVCVFYKQPPDKCDLQLKMMEYLLEKGATLSTVDKGGYAAIDHAAIAGNMTMVKFFLDKGAKVTRKNSIFVAPKKSLLTICKDPEIYRLIKNQLDKETADRQANLERKQRIMDEIKREKDKEKLFADLEKAALKRAKAAFDAEQAILDKEHQARKVILFNKMDKYDGAMQAKMLADKKYRMGEWRKLDGGNWGFSPEKNKVVGNQVYAESGVIMKDCYNKNKRQAFATKWQELTDHDLEIKWDKADPFHLPEFGILNEVIVADGDNFMADNDVYFKDKFDQELDGVDDLGQLFDL